MNEFIELSYPEFGKLFNLFNSYINFQTNKIMPKSYNMVKEL